MTNQFPVQFGRYQLLERLAIGGMAELFKARVVGAHGFQKTVVIKKILPHLATDASFVNMFIDEAKITARLDHPKIAQVLELGTLSDNLYIAMEFVEGVDALALLRAFAQRKQPLPAQLAVHICHEVLDALDYAHQARGDDGAPLGIVHRDISPSNVLVSRRGDVKLADFGIAHALDRQQRTQAGMLKGKYGYMSPEQVVGGDLDARSDLFSVGIILAEMLMGRRLFSAPNELDVLLMVRDVKLDRLTKYGALIPAELHKTLTHALTREPKARFQSAGEFRENLAEWLFSTRQRVAPADVAALVESIGAVPRPVSAQPVPAPVPLEARLSITPPPSTRMVEASRVGPSLTPPPSMTPTPTSSPSHSPLATPPPSSGLRPRRVGVGEGLVARVGNPLSPSSELTPVPGEPGSANRYTPPPRNQPDAIARTPVGPRPFGRSSEMPSVRTPIPSAVPHIPPATPIGPPPTGVGPPPAARAPTAPFKRERPKRSSADIPITVEPVAELSVDEPVVALRPSEQPPQPPPQQPRRPPHVAAASATPVFLDSETSQPIVTIERFPDAELQMDLQAELEAELAQVLGPVLDARQPASGHFGGGSNEADFLDLSVELSLDAPVEPKRPVTGTRIPSVEALLPASRSSNPAESADEGGDLSATSPIHVLYRLAVEKTSGLLVVEVASGRDTGVVKEIFLTGGNPEYVTSNLARELFGEYLVSQRVIAPGELAMALAMMPHFGGRLGDTLVGLGLLKPLDVFRHLTRQVREKIVDVCTWHKGAYRWYAGKRTSRDSFPLGLDAFEVLGAGATALPADLVEAWAEPSFDRLPVAAKNGRVVPEAFRLGTYPRDVYNRLDGRNSLRQLLGRFTNIEDRLAFLRTLYLLNQTELAYWV